MIVAIPTIQSYMYVAKTEVMMMMMMIDDVDNCDDNDAFCNEMMIMIALHMYIVVIKRQTNMRCDS